MKLFCCVPFENNYASHNRVSLIVGKNWNKHQHFNPNLKKSPVKIINANNLFCVLLFSRPRDKSDDHTNGKPIELHNLALKNSRLLQRLTKKSKTVTNDIKTRQQVCILLVCGIRFVRLAYNTGHGIQTFYQLHLK